MAQNRAEARKKGALTIGRARFSKISAVEGLQLSFASQKEFDEDDDLGLTPDERRKRIIAKYVEDANR